MPKKDFTADESTIFDMLNVFSSNCLPSMLYVVHLSLKVESVGFLHDGTQHKLTLEGVGVIKSDEQNNLLGQCTALIIEQQ